MEEFIKAVYYVIESMINPKKQHVHQRMTAHLTVYNTNIDGNRVLSKKQERIKEIGDTKKPDGSNYQTVVVKMQDISAGVHAFIAVTNRKSRIARLPINQARLRYKDLPAYDYNRVKLVQPEGSTESDFINASIIEIKGYEYNFIATQAPLPNTIEHFYQMIEQQNVKVIVMLCELTELGDKKREEPVGPNALPVFYLPLNKNDKLIHGKYTVRCYAKSRKNDLTIRKLKFYITGDRKNCHKVKHVHMSGWGDHSVPKDKECIFNVINKFEKLHDKYPLTPVVIHCSAGCGRTGTFIAIATFRRLILKGEVNTVRFKQHIMDIRKQRHAMVQSSKQFEYIAHTLYFLVDQIRWDDHDNVARQVSAREKAYDADMKKRKKAKKRDKDAFADEPFKHVLIYEDGPFGTIIDPNPPGLFHKIDMKAYNAPRPHTVVEPIATSLPPPVYSSIGLPEPHEYKLYSKHTFEPGNYKRDSESSSNDGSVKSFGSADNQFDELNGQNSIKRNKSIAESIRKKEHLHNTFAENERDSPAFSNKNVDIGVIVKKSSAGSSIEKGTEEEQKKK
uniref:Protein-tyrosine-phosphatase n=1 Tax=Rhabditophanes sp. KR3021 TaxID=114890 RepID=A0AC35U673_9BILA